MEQNKRPSTLDRIKDSVIGMIGKKKKKPRITDRVKATNLKNSPNSTIGLGNTLLNRKKQIDQVPQ